MNLRSIVSAFPPRIGSRLISALLALCITLGCFKCVSLLKSGKKQDTDVGDDVGASADREEPSDSIQTGNDNSSGDPEQAKPIFDGKNAKAVSTLVTADGALMCDLDKKLIIAEKEREMELGSGDISIFMTALIVSEKLSKGSVSETDEAVCPAGAARKANYSLSSDILSVGKRMNIRELLTCMLYQRGSSFAYTLAVHISGSEESFVNEMNLKAKAYGMKNTVFTNVCGADDKEAVTTAYDAALLLSTFLEDARLRKIFCSDEKVTIGMYSQSSSVYLTVSNDFFETHCTPWQAKVDGIIGGKTGSCGYTQWAVVLFLDENTEYAVFVLGSVSPFSDALKIYAEYRP